MFELVCIIAMRRTIVLPNWVLHDSNTYHRALLLWIYYLFFRWPKSISSSVQLHFELQFGRFSQRVHLLLKIIRITAIRSNLDIMCPQFTWNVDQKCKYVEFVRILFKITRPASRKSYLVIIGPNPQEKSSRIRFGHNSESLVYPIENHIW